MVTLDILRRVGASVFGSRDVVAPVADPKMHKLPNRKNGRHRKNAVAEAVIEMKIGDFMLVKREQDRDALLAAMRKRRGMRRLQTRWSRASQAFICTRIK
jgi:hypothetical protein